MSFLWAALMPHPPLLIPQVGRGREHEAGLTLEGTDKLKRALRSALAAGLPEALFVLSPHAPHAPGALFVNSAPVVTGNLARFGAPEAGIKAVCAQEVRAELLQALKAAGLAVRAGDAPDISQDHATIVPLLLIRDCFPKQELPPLIIAGTSGLTLDQARLLGQTLRALPGRKLALLASGDLSHRLKKDGPYGLHPDGAIFDRAVVQALEKGDPAPLLSLSQDQRDNAAECGFRPVLTLLALSAGEPLKVFSYEGPFGVGYCNAFWAPAGAGPRLGVRVLTPRKATGAPPTGNHPYVRLARATVAANLRDEALPRALDIAAEAELWSPRNGCFVSIKNRDGSLRGCIGTFMPTQPGLDLEIMANAVSASTRDPRFKPMTAKELDGVRLSVDVLSAPEPVAGLAELDPKIYGVIVSKGGRRGLLLPDLEGVNSVAQQLAIAAGKAGIDDLEGAAISRFTVRRYKEEES